MLLVFVDPAPAVMCYEYFYYYTTALPAKTIILADAIPPSLGAAGDARDGVYLTTLCPSYGRDVIAYNVRGTDDGSPDQPIEVYIELSLPTRLVSRAADLRDTQVYGGPLRLSGSRWSLRSFSGVLLATECFRVTSVGEAAVLKRSMLGSFKLMRGVVTQGRNFVYQREEGGGYLYRNPAGAWIIGKVAGDDDADLCQVLDADPLQHTWLYKVRHDEWEEDLTITLTPCYLASRRF